MPCTRYTHILNIPLVEAILPQKAGHTKLLLA
jgi:hypothetical protein